MERVEDFNGCWCEATEENYNALIKNKLYSPSTKNKKINKGIWTKIVIENDNTNEFLFALGDTSTYKEITLIDGEFYYVADNDVGESKERPYLYNLKTGKNKIEELEEQKMKNSFEKFGFEEFEKQYETRKVISINLCFENHANFIIGYIETINGKFEKMWNKNGECFSLDGDSQNRYNLTPLKKEWYEKEENFPCVATKDGNNFHILESIDDLKRACIYPDIKKEGFRPATKEEVLKLLIKE